MKKVIFVLVVLVSVLFLFGCTTSSSDQGATSSADNVSATSQWSKEVAALGNPSYEKINVAAGYEILPFPGLTYSGLRDGYQAFYATNKDYSFAIYASPAVVNATGKDYAQVKAGIMQKYGVYSNLTCTDLQSANWLTQAKVFECSYFASQINVQYKSTIFYKSNEYVETILSVWGTSPLSSYEYIFDEFNQKAVSWK